MSAVNTSGARCSLGRPAIKLLGSGGAVLPSHSSATGSRLSVGIGQEVQAQVRFSPDVAAQGERQTYPCEPLAHSVSLAFGGSPGRAVGPVTPATPVCQHGTMEISALQASNTPATAVIIVYRKVLSAEYFGPASAVCSLLTAHGRRSFAAGGAGTCTHAFALQQQVLRHKTRGIDNSGFSPSGWRREVDAVMVSLELTVNGSHASALGPSGIPGRTQLVKVGGRWLFDSYPPSVQP